LQATAPGSTAASARGTLLSLRDELGSSTALEDASAAAVPFMETPLGLLQAMLILPPIMSSAPKSGMMIG
jgi:hypothetical protein